MGVIDSGFGRGTTRADDAPGTPTQSHVSPLSGNKDFDTSGECLTRREDALFWDRPRVVYHRAYFSIRRCGDSKDLYSNFIGRKRFPSIPASISRLFLSFLAFIFRLWSSFPVFISRVYFPHLSAAGSGEPPCRRTAVARAQVPERFLLVAPFGGA